MTNPTHEELHEATPHQLNNINYLYEQLIHCSQSPAEAAFLLTGLLTKLWLSGAAPNASLDAMLTNLTDSLRNNIELNQATRQ